MPASLTGGRRVHYGWVVVFAGMLCIMAALGFGRFALGMLLPSMAASLHLSYSQMGFIGTANFLGYLLSALVSARLSGGPGPRRYASLALLAVAASMALLSVASGFTAVLLLMVAAGFGAAATSIPVMGLVSAWFSSRLRGRAAGFVVVGSGLAIMLSGKLIPRINRAVGPEGWRTGWLVLGGLTALVACVAFALLRNRPEEMGLAPHGGGEARHVPRREGAAAAVTSVYRRGVVYYLGAIYLLFGFAYPIYTMFIVTVLVKERGFSESVAGSFWMWIGFLSLFSGPVFGTLSDRLGRKAGMMLVFSLQAVSYLLVATRLPGAFLYLSIACFGVVAWSIPGIMVAAMGDYVGAGKAAEALGLVTFIYGLGQMSGPAIAGMLAERTGSFSSSFYMAAAAAGIAIVLVALLKAPPGNAAAARPPGGTRQSA